MSHYHRTSGSVDPPQSRLVRDIAEFATAHQRGKPALAQERSVRPYQRYRRRGQPGDDGGRAASLL